MTVSFALNKALFYCSAKSVLLYRNHILKELYIIGLELKSPHNIKELLVSSTLTIAKQFQFAFLN